MGKFFNVKVKPTILASDQHNGAYSAGDLLFDWVAFDMPKGTAAIRGITALIRGVDGAAQTARDLTLYFAHPSRNGVAPTSLGAEHATVNGFGYYNNLIGGVTIDTNSTVGHLDYMSLMATGGGGGGDQVPFINIEGRPNLTKDGYNTVYLAGICGTSSTWNFGTAVVTSQIIDVSGLSAAQLVNADIGGTDPRAVFAPGDIIHAEDDIILGEVESMADTNTITFKADGSATESDTSYTVPATLAAWKIQNGAGTAGDLASGDELYNINPITIIIHFEK
jgi:hypothetical protein